MLIHTDWVADVRVPPRLDESDLFVLCPYVNVITITLKHGTWLVTATHDRTDSKGDMDMLVTLCLMRFNKGEM